MSRNHPNNYSHNHHNNSRSSNNSDGITQSDAVSPRFRIDLTANDSVVNYCYSCKSEFTARNIHDIMEHYSRPHESNLKCLYCKTGKVHQYKSERKGSVQFYHDCYRSKMGYDK